MAKQQPDNEKRADDEAKKKPDEQALAPTGRRHDGDDVSEAPESGDKKTSDNK